MPTLNGRRRTVAPLRSATSAVPSVEASSTTTTSISGPTRTISSITVAIAPSSFHAGTTATSRALIRQPRLPYERGRVRGTGRFPALSGRRGHVRETWFPPRTRAERERCSYEHRRSEPEELEQPPCAMRVRVLVEDSLAGSSPQLLGLPGVGDELAVGVHGLLRALDDDELAPGLEPALDPGVRVRHDRRARGGQLE